MTVTSSQDQTDAVAAAIVGMTGHGVEERGPGMLLTTLQSEGAVTVLVQQLRQHFNPLAVSVVEIDAVDWSTHWRDGIVTVRFGRLVLTPSWLNANADMGDVVVTIDPESAFGSGQHGSTRGALALLEQHLRPGDRVLDLGSGSGLLAIAAARLGARSAIGIEVDQSAIPIAEANADKNGVANRVTFLHGDAADLVRLAGPAELICANILRTVNTRLLPSISEALAPGGGAIFAGMEDAEAELFRPVLRTSGLDVDAEVHDAGWWSVLVRR